MSVTADALDVLLEPTPKDEVKQRQGPGGRMLDYIDARYVMERLDALGQENWQDTYSLLGGGSVQCGIGINVNDQWIWKFDVGTASDIEPEKGAYSDAFKRAAVKWGIGRDLYDHPTTQGRGSSPRPVPSPAVRAAPPAAPAGEPIPPWEDTGTPDDEFRWSAPKAVDASTTCDEHGVDWRGEFGDRYHKKDDGGYCRNAPGNKPKPRRAA